MPTYPVGLYTLPSAWPCAVFGVLCHKLGWYIAEARIALSLAISIAGYHAVQKLRFSRSGRCIRPVCACDLMDSERIVGYTETENRRVAGESSLVPSSRSLYKISQPQRETGQPVHCSDVGLQLRRCSGPVTLYPRCPTPPVCAGGARQEWIVNVGYPL